MKKQITGKKMGIVFLIIFAVIVVALLLFVLLGREKGLQYSFYQVRSEKVPVRKNVRLVVLSDLHNAEFGRDNCELVQKVADVEPDAIIVAGDFIEKDFPLIDEVVDLCTRLNEIAPVYYGIGNHEGTVIFDEKLALDDALNDAGIKVLMNEYGTIEINGVNVDIGGITSGIEDYEKYSKDFVKRFVDNDKDHLKVMITHSPSLYYEKMADEEIDLNVSGHYHGGQIHIPGIGGVYSVDGGFFPRYCDGQFELTNGTLIVSRGLGNGIKIPRLYNDPEIVVIDINQR